MCSKYWTNVSLAAAAASVMTVVASTKLDKGNRDEKDIYGLWSIRSAINNFVKEGSQD